MEAAPAEGSSVTKPQVTGWTGKVEEQPGGPLLGLRPS